MNNRKLIIIIAVIWLLAVAAGIAVWFLRPTGTRVYVTISGEPFGSYDLYRDRTVVIEPSDGSWHNTLRIQGGEAEIVESDCKNQVCVDTPPLNDATVGIIVCLPHGVTVELK